MRLPDRLRTTEKLGDLLIKTPVGVDPGASDRGCEGRPTGRNQILRENGRRRIVILANSDGKTDVTEIVRRAFAPSWRL